MEFGLRASREARPGGRQESPRDLLRACLESGSLRDARPRVEAALGDRRLRVACLQHGGGEVLAIDSRACVTRRPQLDRWLGAGLEGAAGKLLPRLPARSVEEMVASGEGSAEAARSGRVRAGFGRGHLLDVVVYLPGCQGAEDGAALDEAEAWLVGLLGEQLADDWIGSLHVAPLPGRGPLRVLGSEPPGFRLTELPAAVASAIEALHASFSPGPPADEAAWTVFDLEPGPADDRQGDLVTASTCQPELLKCWLSGSRFASCRFSATRERFLQVVVPHAGTRGAALLARRDRLEQALAEHLAGSGAGAVFGLGLGVENAYLDLSLREPDARIPELLAVLEQAGAPEGTWIGAFDDDFADERYRLVP